MTTSKSSTQTTFKPESSPANNIILYEIRENQVIKNSFSRAAETKSGYKSGYFFVATFLLMM
jgi:hypothetical protein